MSAVHALSAGPWRVQHVTREGGREEWRAYGPWRETQEEAERDAQIEAERGRAWLAAQVANADLDEMARACGQRDDEYPRKAIERRITDLTEAIRKIRESAAKVTPGDPDTAYYQLGLIDATAAIALGEDPAHGRPVPPIGGAK